MRAIVQTTVNRYSLYCPVCGSDVLSHYLRDDEPCIHVVYLYFDEVQNFAYISEHHADTFDEQGADIWSEVSPKRLTDMQDCLPSSVLHLVLDTDHRTIGALTGVMRIGFDFNLVDVWTVKR